MIGPIALVHGLYRESRKDAQRSTHWPLIRRQFLREHESCAACGSKKLLQVHHVVPFHRDPAGELLPNNLIALCLFNGCHLKIGHGGSYECFNPDVRWHAEMALMERGETLDHFREAARQARLPNVPA